MNNPYNYCAATHSPLSRRATVPLPASLAAPTASMIDPALENHAFNYSPNPLSQHNSGHHLQPPSHVGSMTNGFSQSLQPSPTLSQQHQARQHAQQQAQQQAQQKQHQQHQQQAQQHQQQQQQQQAQQSQRLEMSAPPVERSLPSKDVSEGTIDSSYVQFILYCNPSIPLDTETGELKKGFQTPPRSDGNSFSTWTLFILLQRLERKEIKTWAHLVSELGVEPPDQNQSTQKVQQYAVRLKRWLHAFHIDAFFNYLTSKPCSYATDRPVTDAELADTIRDGVSPEEDLAVRALLPEWRPKRGRRKADDTHEGDGTNESPNTANTKRHIARGGSADFTTMFEDQYSAAPSSAVPWSANASATAQNDLWQAAHIAIAPKTPSPGQQHQTLSAYPASATQQRNWRFPTPAGASSEAPASPYPQSAITPRAAYSASPAFDDNEPTSANPASGGGRSTSGKARKRNAPAISSAWNQGGTPNGKIRGRPPSNRNVQDGPFGTFPVNPPSKDQSITNTPISSTPRQARASQSPQIGSAAGMPDPAMSQASQPGDHANPNGNAQLRKPSKLQLQVPHQPGNPIRLATPPRVLVNGETQARHERRTSADFFNQLDEGSDGDDAGTNFADSEAGGTDEGGVDWKRRAMTLMRKLQEKEEELKRVKRSVLDAVM